jgi:hypothetical protein
MIGDSVPQNPEVQFRLNSNLMINQGHAKPVGTSPFLHVLFSLAPEPMDSEKDASGSAVTD